MSSPREPHQYTSIPGNMSNLDTCIIDSQNNNQRVCHHGVFLNTILRFATKKLKINSLTKS